MQALRRNGITGDAVPLPLRRDAGFWDGTRWNIKRPSGPYSNQKRWYSGKWKHNMGCLSFMGMDGFFYDSFCEASGHNVDINFMNISQSNERLAAVQVGAAIQYVGSTDKVCM
jgi:hypothetical protein